MEVLAKHRNLRMSPRKVRLLLPALRGRRATDALADLRLTAGAAAEPLAKAIKSAVANAEHNYSLETSSLVVKKLSADEGPVQKRFRAGGRGRANAYQRKTTHLTVVLADVVVPGTKKPKAVKRAIKKVVPKRKAKPEVPKDTAKTADSKAIKQPVAKPRAEVKKIQPRKTSQQTGRDATTRRTGDK